MSDAEKLTLSQKIDIARIAVDGVSQCLASKNDPDTLFGFIPEKTYLQIAYSKLTEIIMQDESELISPENK